MPRRRDRRIVHLLFDQKGLRGVGLENIFFVGPLWGAGLAVSQHPHSHCAGTGGNIVTSGKYRKKDGDGKHFPLDKRGRDAVL